MEKDEVISRLAAIETAENVAFAVDEHGSAEGWLAMLINSLEILPSAQPEQRWISIEDKMPDTNTDVLLQFKSNMGVGFYEDGDWAINTGDGIYSAIGYNEEKPIAWMPLPEPYAERQEE